MSLRQDILKLIPASEVRDIFCDLAEVALDSRLDDGVVKDIPVIGILANLGGAVLSVRDRIFLRKVARFLEASRELPPKTVDAFLASLESEKVQEAVGEKLLLLIERQDDLDKAGILGEVFAHFVAGGIDREHFDMLAHAVTQAYLGDLYRLWTYETRPGDLDDALGQSLLAVGLVLLEVRIGDADYAGNMPALNRYKLSPLGKKLGKILRERDERVQAQSQGKR